MPLWWPCYAMIPHNSPFGTRCCTSWFHLSWESSCGSCRWPSSEWGLGRLSWAVHLAEAWTVKSIWNSSLDKTAMRDGSCGCIEFKDLFGGKTEKTLNFTIQKSCMPWARWTWRSKRFQDSKLQMWIRRLAVCFFWGGSHVKLVVMSGHWTSRVAEIVPNHCRGPSLC